MVEPPSVPPSPPDDSTAKPPVTKPPSQLSQLNQELYARTESDRIKGGEDLLRTMGIHRKPLGEPTETALPPTFESLTTKRAARRRRFFFGMGGLVVALIIFGAAVGGTLWYRGQQTVKPEQIHVTLTAPTDFTAGETITYGIVVRNTSHVAWENVETSFEPPKGFRYRTSTPEMKSSGKLYLLTLGTIPENTEKTIEITGQLLGEYNAALTARAETIFTPENFPSGRFTKEALATTTISQVPVDLAVNATDEAQSGERVLVTIDIRNTSAQALQGAYLTIQPAPGVQLAPEDQQFSPGFSVIDSRWLLGAVEPLASVQRTAVIFVEGAAGERRTLELTLGMRDGEEEFVQRTVTHLLTVTASALALQQHFNDQGDVLTVAPGEEIRSTLQYSNIGNVAIKNAVVRVAFEGTGLDPASLRLPTGAYDPVTKTITWTAASIPELATIQPRQEGTVTYQFRVLPVEAFPTTIKNNTIVATATVDSPDLQTSSGQKLNIVSDRSVVSIATQLQLAVDAFYDDGRLGLHSEGPLPPRVGEQTLYTLRFRLGSALNDVGDVKMAAVLPDGVRYTGQTYKTQGEVTFDERTGEIVWTLPLLEGLTGRVKPGEELHVQVGITPGENQRDKVMSLLNAVRIEATDLFTERSLTEEITTLPTTDTAAPEKGTVE